MLSLQSKNATRVAAARPAARPVIARRVVSTRATQEEVVSTVRELIAEQLAKDLDDVTPSSKFIEDLKADSLDVVEIMMALEEKFDIQLDEEGAENITTVQEAADVVVAKVASK